jgi:hypothetical protein
MFQSFARQDQLSPVVVTFTVCLEQARPIRLHPRPERKESVDCPLGVTVAEQDLNRDDSVGVA